MNNFPASNQRILLSYIGGSYAYGLNTVSSDIDKRGVFIHTDAAHLIGLSKEEPIVIQSSEEDSSFFELRHAIKCILSGNTNMVEMLFLKEALYTSTQWELVQKYKYSLLSTDKIFNAFKGYMEGEIRLANGERTGKLGGKRKAAIDKFGFSPKNFTQLLRLCYCGIIYFQSGIFPVNIKTQAPVEFYEFLMSIKTEPEKFTKNQLNDLYLVWKEKFLVAFNERSVNHSIDLDVVNYLFKEIYVPFIKQL